MTIDISHFVENSLLHLLRRFSTLTERKSMEKTSKYRENTKKLIFLIKIGVRKIAIIRSLLKVEQKTLIFWIY